MRALYEDVWADAPQDPEPWAFRRRRALLHAALRPGDRVLDLGCGAGRFVAVARDAGAEAVGLEVAEAALERARRNVPGARFVLAETGAALPLDDASVDLVWCSEVLEHVADTALLVSEIRRVLAPGGRLLVTVPYHGRVKNAVIGLTRFESHFDPLGQHLRFYTRRSLRDLLAGFGFDDVEISTAGGPPLLRASLVAAAVRASPVIGIRAQARFVPP